MENNTVYIIDAGNSVVKLARFVDDKLVEIQRFPSNSLHDFESFIVQNPGKYALASVLSDEKTVRIIREIPGIVLLKPDSKVPLSIQYGTSNTLGMDRLCNAVYAFNRMKTEYAITVDVGTCIKFDIVHRTQGYLGGSISPGIDLRYKSLHNYTDKLPLISNKLPLDYVGTDTETSIRSGVMNGINAEINEMVEQYRKRFSSLTFFMTGGDANRFVFLSKNDIFADENLTLIGLYEIYTQNA